MRIFDADLVSIRQNESFERTSLIITFTPLIKFILIENVAMKMSYEI